MRMCVVWARGGGDAVSLAWSLRRAAPRLLLDDADPAVTSYYYAYLMPIYHILATRPHFARVRP